MMPEIVNPEAYAGLSEAMGEAFAAELVVTFLDDAPNMIAELHTAIATRDADVYRRAAHSIKSNAETFGASLLADHARDMELSGLPEGASPVTALQEIFAQTARALRALVDG